MGLKIQIITDKSVWESFIQSKHTSFFQSWSWGEVLEKHGHETVRLGIYDEENLVGVALGSIVKARRGKYIHFRHGPVVDWANPELIKFTLDSLKQIAKSRGLWFVRISPLITREQYNKSILSKVQNYKSQMHNVDAEQTWILDLSPSEEELLTNMRKNTRYLIKKAQKDGVEIIKTKDSKFLQPFWEIYQDTVKRHNWTAYSLDYIKDEFETFAKNDEELMFLAMYKGKFIAAAIFNFYNGQSVYHHSGSLTKFRKVPASYLMQWEAIREAKSRGMKRHNFWGVPLNLNNELDMNDKWSGLGLFKVGFGGYGERNIHARDIPVSRMFWLTHLFEKIERIKRGYK